MQEQADIFVDAFSGSVCQNKFTSSMLNYNFPDNETTTTTYTMPQGCSLTCNCCGPRCHYLTATGPTDPPQGSGKKGLFYFFHDYTGDGSWSNSQFHLYQIADPRNMLIVAPNGRQVIRPFSRARASRFVRVLCVRRTPEPLKD